MTKKKLWIAIGVVAGLALVTWLSLSGNGSRKGTGVEIEKTGRRTVVSRVKASGTINPLKKVEIQSKVIGEIVDLPVREGDAVRSGQVLIEIEKKLYQSTRDQAQAALDQATVNLEQAKAELANAELSLRRAEKLRAEGVVSEESVDTAKLRRETAAIAVRAHAELIRQYRFGYQKAIEDLERTTIRAPMDGVVTKLNVERGETAVTGTMNFAGSVLMVVGDLSELLAEVEVAESEVVNLAASQAAVVKVDALPDTPLPGKVVEIGSSGDKQGDVVRFRVKVLLDKPDLRVKPGMTAKVEITTARAENVLALPQQALQTRWLDAKSKEVDRKEGDTSQREITAVYLEKDGKAVRREVKGGIHDELWSEIKEGLSEGEEVITGPYKELRSMKDGNAVRREKKKPGASAEKTETKASVTID
jgi:HlyD family secretion protein